MRRYLLPVLTWPVLPRLPNLPPAERRDLLLRCYDQVTETREAWGCLSLLAVLGVPMLAGLVGFASNSTFSRLSGTEIDGLLGAVAALYGLAVWASYLLTARAMRPVLLAALHDRGVCQGCGYDLRGTATVCPECGKRTTWPDWS